VCERIPPASCVERWECLGKRRPSGSSPPRFILRIVLDDQIADRGAVQTKAEVAEPQIGRIDEDGCVLLCRNQPRDFDAPRVQREGRGVKRHGSRFTPFAEADIEPMLEGRQDPAGSRFRHQVAIREPTDASGFDRHRGLTWHGQLISDACERRAQGPTLQNSVLLSRGQAAEQPVPGDARTHGFVWL